MTSRGSGLRDYDWSLPPWDTALAIAAMRLGMLALVIVAAAWGMGVLARHFAISGTRSPNAAGPSS